MKKVVGFILMLMVLFSFSAMFLFEQGYKGICIPHVILCNLKRQQQ